MRSQASNSMQPLTPRFMKIISTIVPWLSGWTGRPREPESAETCLPTISGILWWKFPMARTLWTTTFFTSPYSFENASQGGAYVHNLILGKYEALGCADPFHPVSFPTYHGHYGIVFYLWRRRPVLPEYFRGRSRQTGRKAAMYLAEPVLSMSILLPGKNMWILLKRHIRETRICM